MNTDCSSYEKNPRQIDASTKSNRTLRKTKKTDQKNYNSFEYVLKITNI